MLEALGRFLFEKPDPAQSFLVRLAMLLVGVLSLFGGIFAALGGHWAALIIIPFGCLVLWAWWQTVRRRALLLPSDQACPLRLTAAAHQKLAALVQQQQAVLGETFMRISVEPQVDGREEFALSFTVVRDEQRERLFVLDGVPLLIPRTDLDYLADYEMDFVDTGRSSGFAFHKRSSPKP